MISRDMLIEEIIRKHPETIEVFKRFGLECMHCQIASFEDVAGGAEVHQVDVEALIEALNQAVKTD